MYLHGSINTSQNYRYTRCPMRPCRACLLGPSLADLLTQAKSNFKIEKKKFFVQILSSK